MVTLDRIYLANAKLEIQFMSEHWKYHVRVWMKKLGHTNRKTKNHFIAIIWSSTMWKHYWSGFISVPGITSMNGWNLKFCFLGKLLKKGIIEVFSETWPCLIKYQWHGNKKASKFWKLTALISWQHNNVTTKTKLRTKYLHRLALAIHLSFCERKLKEVNVVDILNVGKCRRNAT